MNTIVWFYGYLTNFFADLAAPVFALSVNVDVNAQGQISIGALADTVYEMFNSTALNMQTIGSLAVGSPQSGQNCNCLARTPSSFALVLTGHIEDSQLPGQCSAEGCWPNPNPIEEFFTDGKK